ncbi:MAG: hypothetical protein AB4058_01560 [Microcystaceae cyanobacterium]
MNIENEHRLWLELKFLKEKLILVLTESDRLVWLQSSLLQIRHRILPLLHPKYWLY